jgi:hypothetical protein
VCISKVIKHFFVLSDNALRIVSNEILEVDVIVPLLLLSSKAVILWNVALDVLKYRYQKFS